MPEYPGIELYRECLTSRIEGKVLTGVRIKGPSLLRTVEPKLVRPNRNKFARQSRDL